MPNITVPEIQRTSLLSACLYLKSLSSDIDVISFDYLDPPQVSFNLCHGTHGSWH